MAPEILRGEKYTEAADVYSFGVILWEMMTNKIPHHGRSHSQITGLVGYHKETLKVPPQLNKDLRVIVNNCLIFEPSRRPNFEHIVTFLSEIES
jgi:serine/threonine protein kinase